MPLLRSLVQRIAPAGSRRRALLRRVRAVLAPPPPPIPPSAAELARQRLRVNHRSIDAGEKARLRELLTKLYFLDDHALLDSPEGRAAMDDQLTGRLAEVRESVVPWLDAARPLPGARVLEVGCGTGSASVALAEPGAVLTAIDVHESGLAVARRRVAAYGVEVDLRLLNAVDMAAAFAGQRFDLVIFYACLEHIVIPERLQAIRAGWELVDDGGLLGVIDTPNRLWHTDLHTSWLPFFDWLPEELGLEYARRSPRQAFTADFAKPAPDLLPKFRCWGRGVSYHEFELALGPLDQLEVAGYLPSPPRKSPLDLEYQSLLARLAPDVPAAFREPNLNFLLRRPTPSSPGR